jgi:hypothetical protein
MKKTLLLTITGILFFVIKSESQSTEFGLRGGLNLSDIHATETNSLNTRASVFIGGLAHIHLSKTFAIQPELDYSCQGATQNTDGGDVTWRLNYVNVPVLLQYMFDNGFRIQTGPQLGLLASAKRKAGGNINDIGNNFTTGDFSWSLGAGYLTQSGLGFDVRYNLGINNINNTGSADKMQNRVFQAGLFYQFKHL